MRPGSTYRRCLILIVASALLVQGCGTLMSGRSQKIPVTSTPAGADIKVDGVRVGFAPRTILLRRGGAHTIRIEKEGYNPFEIAVSRKRGPKSVLGMVVFDVLSGVALGYLVGRLVGTALASAEVPHNVNESYWVVRGPVIGMIAVPPIMIAIDFGSHPQYVMSPSTIEVTLTQVDGQPRTDVIHVDAERFAGVRWIRVGFTPQRAPGIGGR